MNLAGTKTRHNITAPKLDGAPIEGIQFPDKDGKSAGPIIRAAKENPE
jgi:hypothetical protein